MDVYKSLIRAELEKSTLYKTLACYYEYLNPPLYECYYEKYTACVRKLAELVCIYGDPFADKPGHYSEAEAEAYARSFAPGTAGGPHPFAQERDGKARIRVLHASPDAPAVDVYANGKLLAAKLPYKTVTSYAVVPGGTYLIDVFPAGQHDKPILSETVAAEPGASYTVAAAGLLSKLSLLVYEDDSSPVQGAAKVRLLHLSPDAPAVDIAAKGGDVLFPNVAYQGHSAYVTVQPGPVDLEVRRAGELRPILVLRKVEPEPGRVYTVAAVGLLDGTPPFEALLLAD